MNRLWFKIMAAFLLVAILVVALVAIMANRVTSSGFRQFLNEDSAAGAAPLLDDLAGYYAATGGWDGVETVLRSYLPGRGSGGGGSFLMVVDGSGDVVATAGGGRGRASSGIDADERYPIMVDGRQVGGLVIDEPGMMGGGAGEQFLAGVNQAIVLAALGAVLLALVLGALLARGLTRPLGRLTQATRAMAEGQLNQQVMVESKDELGELAASFNQMAAALAAAESQRQQLFADIAHELRTPISVIRGQLEGMQDGLLERSPENLDLVYHETILLGKLVDDLRTLSLAESGRLPLEKENVDPERQIRQAVTAFEPLAESDGIRLVVEVEAGLPAIVADPARLQQVLGNLLSNALRHAGEGQGAAAEVIIRATGTDGAVKVSVCDNGPGMTEEARRHVFDRFWRADTSRSRDSGGTGLGLAICKGIVQAHGGRIWVESTPSRGACFNLELPVSDIERAAADGQ